MASNKNRLDLVNDPVRLAQEFAQAQIDAFLGQLAPKKDPLRQFLRDNDVLIKDLQER